MHEHRRGFARPFPTAPLKSTTLAPTVQGRRWAGAEDWACLPILGLGCSRGGFPAPAAIQ